MHISAAIRQMLPPVDPRTPQQVDRDIDDEFAFHLSMLADAERAAGRDDESARRIALKRFGDVSKWRKRCRSIALKERLMLQRINVASTIILMLVVIGVGIQVYTTQRYNTLALQDITAQIGNMRYEADTAARETQANGGASPTAGNESNRISPELEARFEMLSRLIGVWELDDPTGRLPADVRLLVIRNEPPGRASRLTRGVYPATDIYLSSDETWIAADFTADADRDGAEGESNDLRLRAKDRGRSLFGPNSFIIDGGWRLNGADSLVLDLRAVLGVRLELSDELRRFVMVPLAYTRVTQPHSERAGGPQRVAHIFGDVTMPGRYDFPPSAQLTLQSALEKAGVAHAQTGTARVFMMKDDGPSVTLDHDLSELRDPSFPPVPLDPDSVVQVIADNAGNEMKSARARDPNSANHILPGPAHIVLRGHVQRPGVYNVTQRSPLTLARIIAAAGGPSVDDAHVALFRASQGQWAVVFDAPLSAILGDPSADQTLEGGEIVQVLNRHDKTFEAQLHEIKHIEVLEEQRALERAGVVYLYGDLERGGVYNLPPNSRLTVSRLLEAAGMKETDDPRHLIVVRRRSDGDDLTVLDLPLAEFLADRLTHDIVVQPNDLITIKALNTNSD